MYGITKVVEMAGVFCFGSKVYYNELALSRAQVSMYNDEIFIIGKPPILLHSKDSGKSWERVPLSPKVSRNPSVWVI